MEQNKNDNDKAKKLSKVRRKLFVDEEENENEKSRATDENLTNKFLEEILMDRAKMEEKWNFDFKNGQPLPGNWEYVRPHEKFKDNLNTDDKL